MLSGISGPVAIRIVNCIGYIYKVPNLGEDKWILLNSFRRPFQRFFNTQFKQILRVMPPGVGWKDSFVPAKFLFFPDLSHSGN